MEKTKTSVKVSGKNAKGGDVSLEAEMLLVAVGRMPYPGKTWDSKAPKVKVNPRGTIEVNEYCETGEPGVFAIGDVIDTAWLAHLASKEGIMVVEKIAGKKVEPINQQPRAELHLLRPGSRQRRPDRSEGKRSGL